MKRTLTGVFVFLHVLQIVLMYILYSCLRQPSERLLREASCFESWTFTLACARIAILSFLFEKGRCGHTKLLLSLSKTNILIFSCLYSHYFQFYLPPLSPPPKNKKQIHSNNANKLNTPKHHLSNNIDNPFPNNRFYSRNPLQNRKTFILQYRSNDNLSIE